ncbi:MAG: hypothetical protein QM523_02345 [Candidatus Pacebacteria bacterium]|nr:hypothetical protein [Candidatus Paceibacterota bacterium]
MVRNFSPSDADSRSLVAAVRNLGEALGREASHLKREVHGRYYPAFGRVEGFARRRLLMVLRPWDRIFSQESMELLHFSYDVEEKLIQSIASHHRAESLEILRALRERLDRLDRLLRATHRRVRKFRSDPVMDTERLYDLAKQTERIALYAQYLSLILLKPPGSAAAITDARFLGVDGGFDWQDVEALADHWPEVVEAEVVTGETAEFAYDRPASRYSVRPQQGSRGSELIRKLRR